MSTRALKRRFVHSLTGLLPTLPAALPTRRLFPYRCPLCCVVETDGGLCDHCFGELPALATHCRICCEPLTSPPDAAVRTCARCLRKPPPYDRTLAPCRYAPPADRLVREFKYGLRLEHALTLGKLLARHVRARGGAPPDVLTGVPPGAPDCIVPVPLHRERLRRRGFNQSLEIARVLATELGLSLDAACLEKSRHTEPQTALDAQHRRRNLQGAFRLRRPPRAGKTAATGVAIVDDVMTTGATAAEIAKLLARAGVGYIEVWVVARATM